MTRFFRNFFIRVIVFATMTCGHNAIHAAGPTKVQVAADIKYSIGFHETEDEESYNAGNDNLNGFLYRLSVLYNINSKFSAGIGIGADVYRSGPNSVPVFATFRHRPLQKQYLSDFYYYSNLGYGIPFRPRRSLPPGWMWDIGIGWQKNFRKHFGLNIQICYSLKQFDSQKWNFNTDGTIVACNSNIIRQSISFGIGIVI